MKYKPLNTYGSISLSIGCFITFAATIFIMIAVILFQADFFTALLLIAISAITNIIFLYFFIDFIFIKNIVINEKGIKYKAINKKLFIKWCDIKTIGVIYGPLAVPVIHFATIDAEGIPRETLAKTFTKANITDKHIKFNYRKGMEDTIRLYWKEDILGIDIE